LDRDGGSCGLTNVDPVTANRALDNRPIGRMTAEHAQASEADLGYAERSSQPTTLAFVRTIDGEAHYAFYDEGTAARNWAYRQGSLPFAEIDALHIGSTTLVDGGGAVQVLAMIDDAGASTTISFDPNCRPALVRNKAEYVHRMDQFAARADFVRLSDSGFEYLFNKSDYARKAEALLAAGSSLVVVTRGVRGARAWHAQAGATEVEAPRIEVVDTIGAGDSFQAGLLFALRAMGRIETRALARMSADELQRALSFAAACAAITCGRPGANPPRLCEISAKLIDSLCAPDAARQSRQSSL
jgi:fructokinase